MNISVVFPLGNLLGQWAQDGEIPDDEDAAVWFRIFLRFNNA